MKLGINNSLYKFTKRLGVELVTRNLSLELPRLPISVEDAVAKKIEETAYKERAFLVVEEVGLEHVLDVGRVCSKDLAITKRVVESVSCRGRALEDLCSPLHTIASIGFDVEIGTDYWIRLGENNGWR